MSKEENLIPISECVEMTQKRATYFRQKYMSEIEKRAKDCQKADPSDPFVYGRVKAHYLSGLCDEIDAYSATPTSQKRP